LVSLRELPWRVLLCLRRQPAWALPPVLQSALRDIDADRLYAHQVQATNAAHHGLQGILATGTAIGKALAYNVPILEALVADWCARALCLFPTKALAQDQLRSLHRLTR
jgi:DEAD/DEAH box helicase domain-containing protein